MGTFSSFLNQRFELNSEIRQNKCNLRLRIICQAKSLSLHGIYVFERKEMNKIERQKGQNDAGRKLTYDRRKETDRQTGRQTDRERREKM